ncbi:MAG: hypothetical protein KJ697_00310 [Nanoarchaeota archaeon]|nr:hypothetical protein [Nanoarchaeota archaeon]MBU4124241.1 hypothetical protein [Nanoarchaeota archaeon]
MRAEEFLENTSGKTVIFFHNDTDGCASAAMMMKYIKDTELMSGDVSDDVFKNLGNDFDRIIFVDYPVDQYLEWFERLKGKDVMVIDHHPIANDLNKIGFVHINPRFKEPNKYISCSQVVHKIVTKLGVEDTDWIMRVGAVGDAALKGTKNEKDAVMMIEGFKTFKKAKKLPELVRFMLGCYNVEDFVYSEYRDYMDRLRKEIENEVIRFEMHGVKEVNFHEIKSRYGIISVLSNALFEKYPDKTIIIYREKDDWYRVSGRSTKFDVGATFKKAAEGIGVGGGHVKAGGAHVKDFIIFKEKVLKLLQSS